MTATHPAASIRRYSERARSARDELNAVLDAGDHVAALSTVVDGQPWVVPMLYGRVGDRVLLHGSTGAGALRHVLTTGVPVALSVTHLDGWVYAHTLFDSSANYRSAVVRGELTLLTADEATRALTELSDQIFPGRSAEVPAHTRKQMAATHVLAMSITDDNWTVKVRSGPPSPPEPDEEVAAELWTGVLPLHRVYGEPESAARVAAGVEVSPSVRALVDGRT